jgi:hypothetical protein
MFDKAVKIVEHLSPDEETALIDYLLERARQRQLSVQEKMTLLRAVQTDTPINEEPSIRREDWYDGR